MGAATGGRAIGAAHRPAVHTSSPGQSRSTLQIGEPAGFDAVGAALHLPPMHTSSPGQSRSARHIGGAAGFTATGAEHFPAEQTRSPGHSRSARQVVGCGALAAAGSAHRPDAQTRSPGQSRSARQIVGAGGFAAVGAEHLPAAHRRSPGQSRSARQLVGAGGFAAVGAVDPRFVPAAQAYRAFFNNEKRGLDRIAWDTMRNTPNLHIGYYLQAVHARGSRRLSDARSYLTKAVAPMATETPRCAGEVGRLRRRCCATTGA